MADCEMLTVSSNLSNDSMIRENEQKGTQDPVNWVPSEDAALPVVNDSQCVIIVRGPNPKDLDPEDGGNTPDLPGDISDQSDPPEPLEKQWSDLTCKERAQRVLVWIGKPLAVLVFLFLFICSLDLLSSAFRLLGGKAAGNAFSSSVLIQNPVAGLMIGILSTVLVQSSSTSTSIVVAMVSSGIIGVRPAIPIIMGANIGTSVTNTIVSLAQSSDRGQFELAFAGATVHDMFNWLAVIVLLPLEIASGYLYHLTKYLVEKGNFETYSGGNKDILKALTKPLTKLVIQLDKNVIKKLALGHEEYQNRTLLKQWCKYDTTLVAVSENETEAVNGTSSGYDVLVNGTAFKIHKEPTEPCQYLFKMIPLNDTFLGLILLLVSLVILCVCLVLVVKILNSALKGSVSKAARKIINRDLPGKCAYFTGYLVILAGAGLTILVQSSSVFTSTMTPLVGLNVISLERMYPLTLGSNIGTTATGLLAAMAASGDKLHLALQIALVHLFFNISGILLFFPVPWTRFPIPMAKVMGRTTAKYRWFAIFYLVAMFFLLPGGLFALSLAGTVPFVIVGSLCVGFVTFLIVVNVMQKKYRSRLSKCAKTFLDCLPRLCFSLEPADRVIQFLTRGLRALCCCSCCKNDEASKSLGSSEPMLDQSDSSMSSDGSRGSIRKNDSFYDRMTEEQRKDYESTVRSLEEVKVMLTAVEKDSGAAGTDSGYVTQINTPYLSKFPSHEDFSRL